MSTKTQKVVIGLAIAAVVVLVLVGFITGAAVYGWRAATRAGNEAATIQNLKTIAAVETQYFNTHNRTFGTFDHLVSEKMLSLKFAGTPPVADGYILTLSLADKPMGSATSYTLAADPIDSDYREKHFYVDSKSDQIHVNADRGAGPSDPVVNQ